MLLDNDMNQQLNMEKWKFKLIKKEGMNREELNKGTVIKNKTNKNKKEHVQ